MTTSKREKIILALAILAVLYLGLQYLFSDSGGELSKQEAENNSTYEFVMEVAHDIARYNLTKTEQSVLARAQEPWPDSPFIPYKALSGNVQAAVSPTMTTEDYGEYRFTGYLKVGNKQLAIINGEEYETGDRLIESNATVRNISPEQVLLTDAAGRTLSVSRADLIR
jgi:hypothetical protein